MEYRNWEHKILMQLIASLQLCDHMGDVGNDVDDVLKLLGIEPPKSNTESDDDWLYKWLYEHGVTTLNGIELTVQDEDG